MGWTLGRYFFFRYAVISLWFFLGVFALIFIVDVTEFASRSAGIPGFTFSLALLVASFRVPMIMQQTVPFVGLFSAMATLVSLNRKYELVIARAAGISAWQFLTPIAIGALLFGVLTITVLNPIAANGFQRAEQLETEFRSGKSNDVAEDVVPWLTQKVDGQKVTIGARAILDQGLTLADASFFFFDANKEIVMRKDAQRALLRDGYWELRNVRTFKEGQQVAQSDSDRIPTNLTRETVQERLARPETIPFFELPKKIEIARSFGLKANAFSMQFHSLVALPFLMVAMTLIAATVSMRFARMGQSATMILGGIVAGFLLYVVSVLVKAFGNAGFVPTYMAAWFPVVVAMFFGVTFLLYKEDG